MKSVEKKKYNPDILFNRNNTYYNYLFANYLNETYPKVTCMQNDLLLQFNYNKIKIIYNGYSQVYNKTNTNSVFLLNFINSCKNRFVLLPILYFEFYNILIYDTKLKQLELFNPAGISAIEYYNLLAREVEHSNPYAYNKNTYADFLKIIKNLFKDIDNKIKFFPPVSFFPKDINFLSSQIINCTNVDFHKNLVLLRHLFSNFFTNTINFSIAWSFYYIEKRLQNPNKSRDVLVKELLSLFNKDVKSKGNESNTKLNLPICEIIKDYAAFLQHLDNDVSLFKRLKINLKVNKGDLFKSTAFFLSLLSLWLGAKYIEKRQKRNF